MRFVAVGLSHKTASIALRERFAQATRDLPQALRDIKRLESVTEVCVVSTCNRVEFYVAGESEPKVLGRALRNHLQGFAALPPEDLNPHLYQHEGAQGLKHLFRVASSLDSMVLGEPQILGQVKEAYRIAEETGTLGGTLTRAFQKSFSVAKRVRTDTGINENAVSMSFAAVELAREIFSSLEGKEVLLVGAGKMAGLAAKHLLACGVDRVRVASRTLATAEKLAQEIGATASNLSDLPLLLSQADIVISSTAAPGYVVDRKMMKRVMRERRYRSILFVDIAVPRDIDPAVTKIDNVFAYDVDELEQVLDNNREARAREAANAEQLVVEELDGYVRWARSQEVVPVIKALRQKAMVIAQSESERTLSHVKGADKKTVQSINKMGPSIVNKLLHPVLTKLKDEGASGDPQPLIDALVTLFDLNTQANSNPPQPSDRTNDRGGDRRGDSGSKASPDNILQFRQRDKG